MIQKLSGLLAAALVLAACGATPSTTGPGVATNPPAAGTSLTPNPAATTTGAGGGAANWCLNTVEEVEAAIDLDVVEAVGTDAVGIGGGCLYNGADAVPVYAISVVTASGAVATFDAAKSGAEAEVIDGVGDDAVLISPLGPLAVLKGSTFISIGAFGAIAGDAAAFRAAMIELGKAAADRLP